jgi:hypothetical protein
MLAFAGAGKKGGIFPFFFDKRGHGIDIAFQHSSKRSKLHEESLWNRKPSNGA